MTKKVFLSGTKRTRNSYSSLSSVTSVVKNLWRKMAECGGFCRVNAHSKWLFSLPSVTSVVKNLWRIMADFVGIVANYGEVCPSA